MINPQYMENLQKKFGMITYTKYTSLNQQMEYTHVDELKLAEIVYRFTQAARKYGYSRFRCSEGIPDDELPKLTNKVLETFQHIENPLKIDAEACLLVGHLKYYHESQLPFELPIQWELYKDISEKKILIKHKGLAETSVRRPVTSYDALILANQILIAKKVTMLLKLNMKTQKITSTVSLCPLVKKAILVLQAALFKAPCLILELMNVDGANDKIVKAPYNTVADIVDFRSANACLYNLGGTTSFMISTIQCLHWVPELKKALFRWSPCFEISCDHLLTAAMRGLFKELDGKVSRVEPRKFLQLFRAKFPKSSQLDDFNNQQDAIECWMQLLDTLSQVLESSSDYRGNPDIVKDLFEIKLISCRGKEEEHLMKPCQTHRREKASMLRRHNSRRGYGRTPEAKSLAMLKWCVADKVDHLHEGLRDNLESEIGDASPSSIGGLPRYLTIEFLYDGQKASCKINLLTVDVYDLCSDELREKLKPAREAAGLSVREEKRPGLKEDQDVTMSDATEEVQLTGVYDLFTVLTHSKTPHHESIVSPGHYDAIVKNGEHGNWIMYRDEHRYLICPNIMVNYIMRGGGAGELAPVICLYKARAAN